MLFSIPHLPAVALLSKRFEWDRGCHLQEVWSKSALPPQWHTLVFSSCLSSVILSFSVCDSRCFLSCLQRIRATDVYWFLPASFCGKEFFFYISLAILGVCSFPFLWKSSLPSQTHWLGGSSADGLLHCWLKCTLFCWFERILASLIHFIFSSHLLILLYQLSLLILKKPSLASNNILLW